MSPFDRALTIQLDQLRKSSLYRELRRVDSPQGARITVTDRRLLNFSSNDYLGLANHAGLREAAAQAVIDFGTGAGASRLICGSLAVYHQLEEALAAFKGTAAALTFSSGYAAATGTITSLVGKLDIVILDKRIHACVIDAARLSGARIRIFRHNDLNDLEAKLKWAAGQAQTRTPLPRILVVTEGVFSMDGDLAPLREIVDLKEKYEAWLMLDEAHATGLYGEHRRGVAEAYDLDGQIEIQMGTLGKALGAAGGYICGSRTLIDLLINRARNFIFSTAPAPAAAAAARAAVELVQSAEGERLRQRLWQRADQVKNAVIRAGWQLPPVRSAILPLRLGDEAGAVELANSLREQGIFVPAIRYPTVARGDARLRLTASAAHSSEDIAALEEALRRQHHALP